MKVIHTVRILLLSATVLVCASLSAADLRITDKSGTVTDLKSAAIDYTFRATYKGLTLLSEVDIEGMGIRISQGSGHILLRWSILDKLTINDVGKNLKAEALLRNGQKKEIELLEKRKPLKGMVDLGEFSIALEDIKTIEVLNDSSSKK